MYTIVLVNVKRFRARCGFYAIENKLLLLLLQRVALHRVALHRVALHRVAFTPHRIYTASHLHHVPFNNNNII